MEAIQFLKKYPDNKVTKLGYIDDIEVFYNPIQNSENIMILSRQGEGIKALIGKYVDMNIYINFYNNIPNRREIN